ncbi:MAG: Bug family tripartite tricarboxylate transporter substrate binding protein [Xanthobacteraceae bacterium]
MIRFLAILVAAALAAGIAHAQTWPDRPVRVIVPFPAGSSADVAARILGNELNTRLGQQLVTDNRPGASGNIGSDVVAKAAPDGYTLGFATTSTHAVAVGLSPTLPYDPVKSFAPVALISISPYVLVVYPKLPANNLADLIALAKSKPGTVSYGSAGLASLAHLASALFENLAGVKLNHIPYKSSAQSVVDLISGRLDMQFATIPPTISNINAGQVRALATTGTRRVSALPDVPTMAEAGMANYDASLWLAMVAPAGTPPDIVNRLNREIVEVLNMPRIKEALAVQGMETEPGPPEALANLIGSEIEKWRKVITQAGIKEN